MVRRSALRPFLPAIGRTWLAAALLAAGLAVPAPARAEAEPAAGAPAAAAPAPAPRPSPFSTPTSASGSYHTYALMLGPNVGGAFHTSPGLLVGGELSFVHFDDGVWFGLYTDVLYDQGLHRTRFSVGPELGFGPFGIDFGYVRELGADPQQGWRVRGLLSAVFITAYAGPGRIRTGEQPFDFWEAGLLFKTPITQF